MYISNYISLLEPFIKGISKTYLKEYYYNTLTKSSTYIPTPNMISHCNHSYTNRLEAALDTEFM